MPAGDAACQNAMALMRPLRKFYTNGSKLCRVATPRPNTKVSKDDNVYFTPYILLFLDENRLVSQEGFCSMG
jgi:hypothetical protein